MGARRLVAAKSDSARATALEREGISYDDVVSVLETEGVDKFDTSWAELLDTVSNELDKA